MPLKIHLALNRILKSVVVFTVTKKKVCENQVISCNTSMCSEMVPNCIVLRYTL